MQSGFKRSSSNTDRNGQYQKNRRLNRREEPQTGNATHTANTGHRNDSNIVHPPSQYSDGRYKIDGVLVIPGKRPQYSAADNERLKAMTAEERQKVQCTKCGQYLHDKHHCPNPGVQCYRRNNFGHLAKICPFFKVDNSKSKLNTALILTLTKNLYLTQHQMHI